MVTQKSSSDTKKTLIIYYSYSGNTKKIAENLKNKTSGDLYEINVVNPYPDDMYETSDRAKEEIKSGKLPELSGELPDISNYDRILIGGPVWSGTLASPLISYLQQVDFEHKEVAGFWTDTGNPGEYQDKFNSYIKNGNILNGLGISNASSLNDDEIDSKLSDWLNALDNNQDKKSSEIEITFRNQKVTAILNDTKAAQELKDELPLEIDMKRMGDHEYYGTLDNPLSEDDQKQTGYEIGDLAYWTPGDMLALYFDEPQEDPEGLIILGKITSDISVLSNADDNETMKIEFTK